MAITLRGQEILDELRMEHGLDPNLPWGGRSPRALTKAWRDATLRRLAAPLDEDRVIDEQYRRFLHGS